MSPLSSLLAGVVVLLIGTLVSRRVALLAKYNIPDPITGGCCSRSSRPLPWS